MGPITHLTTLLAGETDHHRFRYQCMVCQATFETAESDPDIVACEQCGAHQVRSLPRTD